MYIYKMVNFLKSQENLHGFSYRIKIMLNGIAEIFFTDKWLLIEQNRRHCQHKNILLFCFPH